MREAAEQAQIPSSSTNQDLSATTSQTEVIDIPKSVNQTESTDVMLPTEAVASIPQGDPTAVVVLNNMSQQV